MNGFVDLSISLFSCVDSWQLSASLHPDITHTSYIAMTPGDDLAPFWVYDPKDWDKRWFDV